MIYKILISLFLLTSTFAENVSICGKTIIYKSSELVQDGSEIEVGGSRQLSDKEDYQGTILRLALQSSELKLSTAEFPEFIDCLLSNNLLKEVEVVLIWGIKQAVIEINSINKIVNKLVLSGYPLDEIVRQSESDGRNDVLALIYFLTGNKSEKISLNEALVEQVFLPIFSSLISSKDFIKLREVSKRFNESEFLSPKDKVEISKLIFEIEVLSENKLSRSFKDYTGKYWRKELQQLYTEQAMRLAKTKQVWTPDEYLNFILSINLDEVTQDTHVLVRAPLENNEDLLEVNFENQEFTDKIIYFINTSSSFKGLVVTQIIELFEKSISTKSDNAETLFNVLTNCGITEAELRDLQFKLSRLFRDSGDDSRANQYYVPDPKRTFKIIWFASVILIIFFTSYLLFNKYKQRQKQKKKPVKDEGKYEMPVFSQKANELSGERRTLFNKLRELELPIDASQRQVKAKYRNMVKHLHPDLNKDLSAVDLEKFTKYTQIYDEIIVLMKSLKIE